MLTLRAFTEGDFEALRSWAPAPDDVYMFAGSSLYWPLTDDQLRKWQRAEGVASWTAVRSDAPEVAVGHIELVRTGPDSARLARVLLDPAVRGKGFGKALVASAIDAAIAAGTRRIDLNVITGNAPAIATYRRLGFRPLGANPEHPDMTRMRLEASKRNP